MIRVGVIGYGYWGPNIVRNFNIGDSAQVVVVCDQRPEALQRARQNHPQIAITRNAAELSESPSVDVVAVVTPVWTHFDFANAALRNGKHVFVEKPFTFTSQQAEELVNLAEQKHLHIMVDHTFLFTGAVKKIRQLVVDGTLGNLYYYDSMRVNLGLFQHDVNVIWDLAPHDLSIMDHIIQKKPMGVVATAERHFNGLEDIAFLTFYFPDNIIAHVNVNWLSPVKVRTTLIGGQKKMLVWNDLEADEKIRIYDKGVERIEDNQGIYDVLVKYRTGDMWAPQIEHTEALKKELEYFVSCLEDNRSPINDGRAGWRVVSMLEAANQSVKKKGGLVEFWKEEALAA
ncbi:MAG TPA: Gfo/Idh/MocA family oxidoreductase [Terriglobales bacterium]|nr:Gfo/Idh/MocA family oxidoreductase [Terriglobales bacterium]